MTDDTSRLACPDPVAGLPPSAKLVFFLVVVDGPLTTTELQQWLSPSTVRFAVGRLDDVGAVEVTPSEDDPRERVVDAPSIGGRG